MSCLGIAAVYLREVSKGEQCLSGELFDNRYQMRNTRNLEVTHEAV